MAHEERLFIKESFSKAYSGIFLHHVGGLACPLSCLRPGTCLLKPPNKTSPDMNALEAPPP